MTTYRAGVIGLGRMGWLYDASLPYPPSVREEDGTLNELPPLRDRPDIPPTEHPGKEGLPTSYAAALQPAPADGAGGRLRPERGATGGLREAPRGEGAVYRLPGAT